MKRLSFLFALVAMLSSCGQKALAPYEERVAEQLKIKVAVVYEDPVVTADGKRLHEISRIGDWAYWNDPFEQVKVFERDMEAATNGVVDFEIVMQVETPHFYTFKTNAEGAKEWLTADDIAAYCESRDVPGFLSEGMGFDYLQLIEDYGFGKMRDAGELHEVWVYTHPGSCMFESRLIGDGAFWCNSEGITKQMGAKNDKLLPVMFFNYERTVDLALHSYGHRVESIMGRVYGHSEDEPWWLSPSCKSIEEMSPIQLFSAYQGVYGRFDEGYSQVGLVHFPPNGERDYDYSNTTPIKTYADEWMNYPQMDFSPEKVRVVDNSEWAHEGGDQWGFMMWYFSHLPHFKGLDNHGKLNNWWHYIMDWNGALEQEKLLK